MDATRVAGLEQVRAREHGADGMRAGLAFGVLVLFVGLVHHRTLAELWRVWETNDNYSHGPLVPLASIALAWMKRRTLAVLPIRPSTWGLVVVALGCALQILGVRADVFALQGYSIPVLLCGAVMAVYGLSHARVLAFPLGFLAFMLTFPPFVVNQLSFALKELTVRMSTTLAEWLGVTFLRNGMSLYLATGELRIENPCSGLRSLLALIATGALFAHLQPGGWWRRALLLLAAFPIAVIANGLRTTFLIVVGHYASVEEAGGFMHDASGVVLYALALAGMLFVRALLEPRTPAVSAA